VDSILIEGIDKVAIDDVSTCANCGKEGSDVNNECNKCKMVKYCNAACKKKHRSKHKKACERRAVEVYDEALFKDVEPEECPLCFLMLPYESKTSSFMSCCGKVICNGCVYSMKVSEGKDLCAFCRTPPPISDKEDINRTKKMMVRGNAYAFNHLAGYYVQGLGVSQDMSKSNELMLKAGQLGCASGYSNLGYSYHIGNGLGMDEKKAKYYFELAAMNGSVNARHNLGCLEREAGNHHRAYKHNIIAAKTGHKRSLDAVTDAYKKEFVTKDEYANILRAHHERQKEMKSDARDKAAMYYTSG